MQRKVWRQRQRAWVEEVSEGAETWVRKDVSCVSHTLLLNSVASSRWKHSSGIFSLLNFLLSQMHATDTSECMVTFFLLLLWL